MFDANDAIDRFEVQKTHKKKFIENEEEMIESWSDLKFDGKSIVSA